MATRLSRIVRHFSAITESQSVNKLPESNRYAKSTMWHKPFANAI
jgi:hypothetical protein